MKFGLEVEFTGNTDDLIRELRNEGLSQSSRMASYIGFSQTDWTVKRDASVRNGGELVSPPLEFTNEEQRGQIDRAIRAMRRAGCTPDPSAGIHVHIESSGFSAREISCVARLWTRYEDAIYRLASSGWNTIRSGARQWAPRLSDAQKSGLASARTDQALMRAYYQQGRVTDSTTRNHGHGSRYRGLNLHSHWYRGTIEFRVFNSSVNGDRIQMYVALCHAIMQDAKNGKMRSVNRGVVPLGSMANGTADPDKVLFNFLNILRYHGGEMSVDDYRLVKRFWQDSRPQAATAA